MYYIYHIQGVKIGCTDNVQRRIQQQGYSNCEILEEHYDLYKASNRELALQKQYGYSIDKIPYFKSVEQWGAKAGIIGGKKAQKTHRKLNLGFHSKDKTKRTEWGTLGAKAVLKKYGNQHFKNMRANNNCIQKSIEVCSKPINKLDKYNNIIAQYKSISEAAKDNNVSITAISNCLRGKTKSSAGYIWYYQK